VLKFTPHHRLKGAFTVHDDKGNQVGMFHVMNAHLKTFEGVFSLYDQDDMESEYNAGVDQAEQEFGDMAKQQVTTGPGTADSPGQPGV
jgi:hypothetical protein